MGSERTNTELALADNPFCVLKLPASATTGEVQAKYAEARVTARLHSETGERELDRLRRAQTELLDPRSRCIHEAAWFYEPPECLFDGVIANSDQVLRTFQEKTAIPGETGIKGKHDLSNWLLLLATHSGESTKEHAIRALLSWSELVVDPLYVELLTSSSGNQFPGVREIWSTVVLPPFSTIMKKDAADQRIWNVIGYIEAFRESGSSAHDIGTVCSDALREFSNNVESAQAEVQHLLQSQEINETLVGECSTIISQGATPLKSVLTAAVEAGLEVDSLQVECNSILDNAADDIRRMAVDYFNTDDDAAVALRIARRARTIAVSPYITERIESDISVYTFRGKIDQAMDLIGQRRWDQALTFLRESYALAPTGEERVRVQEFIDKVNGIVNQRTSQRNIHDSYRTRPSNEESDIPWGLVGWIVFIAFTVICSALVAAG